MTNVAAFGPGSLYVTRTDIANSTPVNIGFAQEFSIDANFNFKELFGQNQFPLITARSTAKLGGKMKAALISGIAWNNVFFGQSFSPGGLLLQSGESATIPSTPFQITVTHAADFSTDLGVLDSVGNPLMKVASSPATGQYSVNVSTGVYTFASADAADVVRITYLYETTGGQSLVIENELIGTTPTFRLDYATTLNGQTYVITVYQAIGTKLTQAFKLEDFMIPEFDFSIFQADSGQVMSMSFPQAN